MSKMRLFFKLATTNIRRNKTTYLPYILACIVVVITFYNLLYIQNNPYINELRGAEYFQTFIGFGLFIAGLFCFLILIYTNSFVMKRRTKEIGLYSIMGLEKKNIAIILMIETLIVAVISIVIGIFSSLLFSKLFAFILLRLAHFSIAIPMPFVPAVLIKTILFFLVIFAVILFWNMISVAKNNPLALMNNEKTGEREPKASKITTFLGFLCIGLGYFMALRIDNIIMALFSFLIAILFVIIGTYCLFMSGSVFILKRLKQNKKIYYKPSNFITISNLIYRMKQNAAGLATICVLTCGVLVSIALTGSLYLSAEKTIDRMYPYDVSLRMTVPSDLDVPNDESIWSTIEGDEREISITKRNAFTGNLVEATVLNDDPRVQRIIVVSTEEYNRYADIPLSIENNGLYHLQVPSNALRMIDVESPSHEIKIGNDFWPYEVIEGVPSGLYSNEVYEAYFVLPQQIIDTINIQSKLMMMQFDYQAQNDSWQEPSNFLVEVDFPYETEITTKQAMSAEWYSIHGGFLFIGIFFGILFTLATAMIIYYKQISEGYQDQNRYDILQKVGMSNEEVKKTITKQVKSIFYLPLGVAIVHILFATFFLQNILLAFGVFDPMILIIVTVVSVLIFTLIYTFIYRRTSRIYFDLVNHNNQ